MPKPVQKSSLKLRNDIDDVSPETTRVLQMGDSARTENASSEIPACELLGSSRETDEAFNIAQHGTNTDSSGSAEECPPEYNIEDTENPSEWEKEVLVDQQYWEQNGSLTRRENNSRIKKRTSQRLTIRQINNIENSKLDRDPSYFKFDASTTAILKMLIEKKYIGPLHNVVGEGRNSVVIHASSPENSNVVRVAFSHGYAVKIYTLTRDFKENTMILKRAQREYEHLCLLPYFMSVVHRFKNVLTFRFIGENQETAPSITKLSPENFNFAYQIIIRDMDNWYTKYNIVHGNLCSKNILFEKASDYKSPLYQSVIGWGHSVKRDHPRALIKLMRDCHFVTNFFGRRDIPVKSTEELFKDITGLRKISNKLLEVIHSTHKKDLWDEHLTNPNRLPNRQTSIII